MAVPVPAAYVDAVADERAELWRLIEQLRVRAKAGDPADVLDAPWPTGRRLTLLAAIVGSPSRFRPLREALAEFLPFADEDRMTSVILSKVLLLNDDERITDPDILAQLARTA